MTEKEICKTSLSVLLKIYVFKLLCALLALGLFLGFMLVLTRFVSFGITLK